MSEDQVQDADSTAEFQPIVKLEKVEVDSGEKDEKELWKSRSRLYRYAVDKTPPEWVTRGIGHVRFLKHTKNGQTRIVLREGKTLKVRMNHMVQPDAPLKPKAGSEEVCFQWFAKDYAEEDPWEGLFAIKFPTPDVALDFKKQYEAAQKSNKAAASGSGTKELPPVKKHIFKTGSGSYPKLGQKLNLHVTGYLSSNLAEPFWDTVGGKPWSTTLGVAQMIPFWNDAVLGMKVGEKSHFVVPSEQGYGVRGNSDFKIPSNAELVFDIELLSIDGVAPDPEPAPLNPAPKGVTSPPATQPKPKSPATSRETHSTSNDEKKETAWRKLNRSFREHMDKDIKSPNTASADWSTAMSEYLIFAHKLRNDKTTTPTRVLSSKKTVFSKLNTAFHKWATSQKDSALDADWSPPIRDYLNHAQKLVHSS